MKQPIATSHSKNTQDEPSLVTLHQRDSNTCEGCEFLDDALNMEDIDTTLSEETRQAEGECKAGICGVGRSYLNPQQTNPDSSRATH